MPTLNEALSKAIVRLATAAAAATDGGEALNYASAANQLAEARARVTTPGQTRVAGQSGGSRG